MNEVRIIEQPKSTVVTQVSAPMQLIQLAMERGQLDQIDKLLDLQERWEANEARKAYVAAMAKFKSEPIIVEKDGEVDFTHNGKRTNYKHATLAGVVDAVVSRMGKYGLAHKWDTKQTDGAVSVTCVITHELGHSESVTLSGPRDETGNKNILQQIASSITYLQRYTLMSLCGLASKEMDDDGAGAGSQKEKPAAPDGYVKWRADIQAKADEGTAKLQASWKASAEALRTYATAHDLQWWEQTKSKAATVKVPA